MSLWFQRGLHSLCTVKCSMSFLSLGEGRTLSVDFSRSSRLLLLFLLLLLWVSEEHLLCCFAFSLSKEDRQKQKACLGFSRGVSQGCEVTVSFLSPFSGHHLHTYHTPERPGLPCSCSVFRCSSTCPIASSKLGHTKQIYWH